VHKFINRAIAQYVNEDQTDWDELVSCLMLAHNDCIHTINGVSPAEVILGRHMNLPGFEYEDTLPYSEISVKSYAQKLKWALAQTQQIVQGKLAYKLARNEHLNAKITTTKFEIGQAVRLWQPVVIEGKKAKLTQKWFGPFFITNIKNEGRVIYLKDDTGNDMILPVSVNRIWSYPKDLIQNNSSNSSTSNTNNMEVDTDINENSVDELINESYDTSDDDDHEHYNPTVISEPDDDLGYYAPSSSEEDEVNTSFSVASQSSQTTKLPKLTKLGDSASSTDRRSILRKRKPPKTQLYVRALPKHRGKITKST